MAKIDKLFEKRMASVWQKVYDRGFCEGLDKGMSLEDSAEYADLKVLKATEELMYFEPED